MREDYFKSKLQKFTYQRNILYPIVILCIVTIVILSISLAFKRERIIIVPAHITESFWVDTNGVSPSYLEQMSRYFAATLLTKSSSNTVNVIEQALPNIHSTSVGKIREALVNEHLQMKKGNISYVFYPESIEINIRDLISHVSGELVEIIGSSIVRRNKKIFEFSFIYEGGKLMLSNLEAIISKKEKTLWSVE